MQNWCYIYQNPYSGKTVAHSKFKSVETELFSCTYFDKNPRKNQLFLLVK